MTAVRWLPEAVADLERLHAFLHERSSEAAARLAGALLSGTRALESAPHAGRPHPSGAREWLVRFGVTHYVLRYRLLDDETAVVVRVWHERENR